MKTLTLENINELQPFIEAADYNEYNSNIVTMLMWSNMYEVQFEVYEHFAIARTNMPHREPIWMMPYSVPAHRKEAISMIQQRSIDLGMEFEIHSMTIEFKNWLQATYPDRFLVWDCVNARDYVYDRKQQETLVGKKMQKRRNHFHAFIKEYKNRYLYKELEEDDILHIYEFLQEWKSRKEADTSINAEEKGIHLLLSNRHILPIMGGCVYVDGKLEAFHIASKLSKNTIQIHVEKANRNIRGLYIAILKFFLETLDDTIVYINREDDLGLEDLRKAKKDMHPISTTKKFGCVHQVCTIQKATISHIAQMKDLWQTQFQDETIASTSFYFEHLLQLDDCYILTSEEELLCMIQARKMNVMLQRKTQTISFLVGIATNPEYVGCGYMRRLLSYVLQELQQVEPYVVLQAYDPNIYKPFGFEETYNLAKTKLDTSAYRLSNGVVDSQFDTKALLDIYQSYTSDKDGYRIRDFAYFKQREAYMKLWNQQILVHSQDKIKDGYVIYEEHELEIQVLECAYTNEDALHSLLSSLCTSDKPIFVITDMDTQLAGRRKVFSSMMMKPLQENVLPSNTLYMNEEY